MPPWRNRLARSAVNRKVGGSSPPGGGGHLFCHPWPLLNRGPASNPDYRTKPITLLNKNVRYFARRFVREIVDTNFVYGFRSKLQRKRSPFFCVLSCFVDFCKIIDLRGKRHDTRDATRKQPYSRDKIELQP